MNGSLTTSLFDPLLRTLDAALASFGATRGCERQELDASALPTRAQDGICGVGLAVRSRHRHRPQLGLGDHGAGTRFRLSRAHQRASLESVRACDEMRSAIGSVPDSARTCITCASTETFLTDLLVAFDGQLRASVSASLGGDLPGLGGRPPRALPAAGWAHASLGIAVPAFAASRIFAAPGLHRGRLLFVGTPSQPIMAEHDARTDATLARLVSTRTDEHALTLPTKASQLLLGQLGRAGAPLAPRALWDRGRNARSAFSISRARSLHRRR